MTLLGELKRRNVIRKAGLYLVSAWLLVHADQVLMHAEQDHSDASSSASINARARSAAAL